VAWSAGRDISSGATADRPDAKFRIVFSVESSEYHGFQTQANLYSFMDSLQGDAGGTWTRLLTSRARPSLCLALRLPPVVTSGTMVSARSERAARRFDDGWVSLLATTATQERCICPACFRLGVASPS
jgi:hypothetical protein